VRGDGESAAGRPAPGLREGRRIARVHGDRRTPVVRDHPALLAPRWPRVPGGCRRARRSASRGRTFYPTFYPS